MTHAITTSEQLLTALLDTDLSPTALTERVVASAGGVR